MRDAPCGVSRCRTGECNGFSAFDRHFANEMSRDPANGAYRNLVQRPKISELI
jgi:hypothetical protein